MYLKGFSSLECYLNDIVSEDMIILLYQQVFGYQHNCLQILHVEHYKAML